MPKPSITWTKGWEDRVRDAAMQQMREDAADAATAAQTAFEATYGSSTKIGVSSDPDREAVEIGWRRSHWRHAFTETGNQYYPPNPSIEPAVKQQFGS